MVTAVCSPDLAPRSGLKMCKLVLGLDRVRGRVGARVSDRIRVRSMVIIRGTIRVFIRVADEGSGSGYVRGG